MGETPDFTRLAEELARLWEKSIQKRREEERIPGFIEKTVIRQSEMLEELSNRIDSLERELLHVRIQSAEAAIAARDSEKKKRAELEERLSGMEEKLRRLQNG